MVSDSRDSRFRASTRPGGIRAPWGTDIEVTVRRLDGQIRADKLPALKVVLPQLTGSFLPPEDEAEAPPIRARPGAWRRNLAHGPGPSSRPYARTPRVTQASSDGVAVRWKGFASVAVEVGREKGLG